MNVLAQQLSNQEAAGSYSLQCGVDELRAAAVRTASARSYNARTLLPIGFLMRARRASEP